MRSLYARGLDEWHRPLLRRLRQRYYGASRCFVIGNGPSLNKMNLELLADEVTFAVNGFFLKSETLSWCPTFYVVEDHLVAEDRLEEIQSIRGSTKLFPAYLGYCFEEADDTVFFDHRPRPSYPDGFDFSLHADRVTYTGCTVTFTCLQLAAYLGFRQIYLIGVDADYQIPPDATRVEGAEVGVLDMTSEDANHFDPSYFGRGYRWHDPQLDKMLEAYEKARQVTAAAGIAVSNAGVDGKLEVFPRVPFASLFPGRPGLPFGVGGCERDVSDVSDGAVRTPRVAVIDITRRGDGSASGELKRVLLADWDDALVLDVFGIGASGIGISGQVEGVSVERHWIGADEAAGVMRKFAPECVLFRPVPDNGPLHDLAVGFLQSSTTPLVTWILDDWVTRADGRDEASPAASELAWLLARSGRRLVISEPMAAAFSQRYGLDFVPVANGVDVDDWPDPGSETGSTLVVRYAGALAEDMVMASVSRVARVIDELASEGVPMRFEINTAPQWLEAAQRDLGQFDTCSVRGEVLSATAYRRFLASAGINLIAYNFDDLSTSYTRYSLANKLPECLASGQALLVHGPEGIATVDAVRRALPDAVVAESSDAQLRQWLLGMMDANRRRRLAVRCRELALREYSLDERRGVFRSVVAAAVADGSMHGFIRYRQQREAVHLDESALVNHLTAARQGAACVLVDVGARHGRAAAGSAPGQTWRDMAEFLVGHGYTVYVSEWYPASRRGAEDAWRSLRRYPCTLMDAEASGNLLAFRQPPPRRELERAVDGVLVSRAPLLQTTDEAPPRRLVQGVARHGSIALVNLSGWLRRRSPRAWQILRGAKHRIKG